MMAAFLGDMDGAIISRAFKNENEKIAVSIEVVVELE